VSGHHAHPDISASGRCKGGRSFNGCDSDERKSIQQHQGHALAEKSDAKIKNTSSQDKVDTLREPSATTKDDRQDGAHGGEFDPNLVSKSSLLPFLRLEELERISTKQRSEIWAKNMPMVHGKISWEKEGMLDHLSASILENVLCRHMITSPC
jgi:hypothetical protein